MHPFKKPPSVEVRSPEQMQAKTKHAPYMIQWDYPVRYCGRHIGWKRTARRATFEKALEFARKHAIPFKDLPIPLREEICAYALTVKAISSTSSVRSGKSSAPGVDASSHGS
jgi:hypothetical protein